MKTAHTPGPWIIGRRNEGDNTITVGTPINKDATCLKAVAYVAPSAFYEKVHTQDANVHLIAAAPTLCEALSACVAWMLQCDPSAHRKDCIIAARAALALAGKGET